MQHETRTGDLEIAVSEEVVRVGVQRLTVTISYHKRMDSRCGTFPLHKKNPQKNTGKGLKRTRNEKRTNIDDRWHKKKTDPSKSTF